MNVAEGLDMLKKKEARGNVVEEVSLEIVFCRAKSNVLPF